MFNSCVLDRTLFSPIMGEEGYNFHEEAWNAYPYCKTVITNPGFMKDDFKVVLESMHLQDPGDNPNSLEKTKQELTQIPNEARGVTFEYGGLFMMRFGPSVEALPHSGIWFH